MESSPINVKRSGWIVGVLAATGTLFVLGFVSSGFYASAGGLVIAGAVAFFLGSGAAAVVDSRTGRNASIVAFYLVALLAAYLLILPAFDRSIPPDIQRRGPAESSVEEPRRRQKISARPSRTTETRLAFARTTG